MPDEKKSSPRLKRGFYGIEFVAQFSAKNQVIHLNALPGITNAKPWHPHWPHTNPDEGEGIVFLASSKLEAGSKYPGAFVGALAGFVEEVIEQHDSGVYFRVDGDGFAGTCHTSWNPGGVSVVSVLVG